MPKRTLILVAGVALTTVACASTPKEQPAPPQKELVTRQSEPLAAPPKKRSGTPGEVSPAEFEQIEEILQVESTSTEIVNAFALDWADGERHVFVSHIRYPYDDMTEEARETSVDESVIERCEEEFPGCVDSTDDCADEAFESCLRSAYRDPFVYMATEIGQDCAVFDLSVLSGDGADFSIQNRVTLAPVVCDFDSSVGAPAARDLDGDGGPELVYAWSAWDAGPADRTWPLESITILDANTLNTQFTLTSSNTPADEFAQMSNIGLQTMDQDGDDYPDIVLSRVEVTGYCPETGFALGDDFVRANGEYESAEPPCKMNVERSVFRYDAIRDAWNPQRSAEGQQ